MGRREFDIAFVGLKPGIHEYQYEIKDSFFEDFQEQDFRNCAAHVKLSLDKKAGFMLLKFEIGGKVEVACDRCSNPLPLQLWDEFNIVVKLVENPEEMNEREEDPDIYYISRTESHLRIAEWIYEFINLSIPMQKMCSPEEMGGPHCNQEVLAMLNKMEENIQQPNEAPKSNPLWKGLEKFKNLGDN
jgi:uncharacterized metal-binding protein YceD (DUF177 family)